MSAFLLYIGEYFTFGLLDRVHYNEDVVLSRFVLSRFSHTIYCTFGRAEEYRSLYQGLAHKDVRLVNVPLYLSVSFLKIFSSLPFHPLGYPRGC